MGSHFSKATSATPLLSKPLLDLPPEIILCVAGFLPLDSAASLALCCRSLSQLLGPRCWAPLRQHNGVARMAFLCALAKDLPGHFPCHMCSVLHLRGRVEAPWRLTSRGALTCLVKSDSFSQRAGLSPYLLKFAHVQLAMKRHYCGLGHGISLVSLSYTEVEYLDYEDHYRTTFLTIEPRIVSDELLMRSQIWFLLPAHKRNEFVAKIMWVHQPCRRIFDANTHREFRGLVTCALSHPGGRQTCSVCSGTLQCQYCYMDFEIDTRDFGVHGTAVFITRWTNLGAGLTPLDEKWQSHRSLFKLLRPFIAGSIRSSFEDQKGMSIEELTRENMKKLISHKKKKKRFCGPGQYIVLSNPKN